MIHVTLNVKPGGHPNIARGKSTVHSNPIHIVQIKEHEGILPQQNNQCNGFNPRNASSVKPKSRPRRAFTKRRRREQESLDVVVTAAIHGVQHLIDIVLSVDTPEAALKSRGATLR